MKRLALWVVATLGWTALRAQYKPDGKASSLTFVIKNLGFDVTGSFSGLQGQVRFDPEHLDQSGFDVIIDAGTVSTDNSMRDAHLREDGFFDVSHYPSIQFLSSRILPSDKKDIWFVYGKLTIKGHSQDLSFPFRAAPLDGGGYRFTGKFSINRRDFGVGGYSTIADEVDVSLNVIARHV